MPPNPNIAILPATSSIVFLADDATDSRFGISGKLHGGVLTFTVIAELPDGSRSVVSGTEWFDAMMTHFGSAVTMIDGEWSTYDPGLRANIDEFNKLTAAGVSEEDAAAHVWTGRMARRHGYSTVQIVDAWPQNASGHYQEVLARFRKPTGP